MTRADASPPTTVLTGPLTRTDQAGATASGTPIALAAPTQIHLALELEPDSDTALLRVVSTLHRRRCRVLHASFHGDAEDFDQLELHVQAPGPYASRVEHWLRALIDVRRAVTIPSD
jgi:hypothetical protein